MAASLAVDGCAPINNIVNDAKWNDEVLKINNSILMELFEESQSDESDLEQLDDVIRSLEAEINPIEIDCESSVGESEYLVGSWQGDNWLESSNHSWYMEDEYADHEMNCMIEFDTSSVCDYPPISLVEEDGSYGSLWHPTYDHAMQN